MKEPKIHLWIHVIRPSVAGWSSNEHHARTGAIARDAWRKAHGQVD
jgi:hypothetical protein